MIAQQACGLFFATPQAQQGRVALVYDGGSPAPLATKQAAEQRQCLRCDHQLRVHPETALPTSTRLSAEFSRRPLNVIAGRKNVSSRKSQQSKGNRGGVDVPKKLGAVGGSPVKPAPAPKEAGSSASRSLSDEQAIGQVITAQANFMRVLVQRCGGNHGASSSSPGDSGVNIEHERGQFAKGDGEVGSGNGLLGWQTPAEKGSAQCRESRKASSLDADVLEQSVPQNQGKELELLCVVRNVLKKIGRRVLVGDKVLVTGIDWTDKRGMIEDVLDRTSEIFDPPVANVNQLLIIFSVDQPQIDEKILSRFLVEVESTEIPFSLVLNKVDLVEEKMLEHWQERLAGWGYSPILCSAEGRIGLSSLAKLLNDKITVILGPSGVGKSSVINALRDQDGLTLWREFAEGNARSGKELHPADSIARTAQDVNEAFEQLRVGEVSVGSGRGRHTTRHVSLLRVPGGNGRLADTPGFSRPSLARVTSTSLQEHFPEIQRRIDESDIDRCGYPNCLHVGEPFCLVGEKWDRHLHYKDLLEEVRNREQVEKMVLGTKREEEVRYKVRADGVKQAEPRLELKKHRRTSRRQLKQSLDGDLQDEEELEANLDAELEADLEDTRSHL